MEKLWICKPPRVRSHALGSALDNEMRNLGVGVVGCGGTGSATAMLLGRLGVGRVALFDRDFVETTNLNRLHGATMRRAGDQLADAVVKAGLFDWLIERTA